MTETERISATLKEGKVYVNLESRPEAGKLLSRGYGEKVDGKLELEAWEALHLVKEGLLEVSDEAGEKLG
ncbi:hypothetical protein DRO53_00835, partial [Candidatus Bathyarchaeota archaeon]